MKEHKKMRSGVLGVLLLAAVLCFPIQTQAATLKLNEHGQETHLCAVCGILLETNRAITKSSNVRF